MLSLFSDDVNSNSKDIQYNNKNHFSPTISDEYMELYSSIDMSTLDRVLSKHKCIFYLYVCFFSL